MTTTHLPDLMQNNILIDLDVSIPLGVTRGMPSDIFLADESMPKDIFSLAKRYIPRNWTSAHRNLEGKALRLIEQHSSPVLWPMGKARFLMPDSVPNVIDGLHLIKAAFDEQTEVRVDGLFYEDMRQKVLTEHPRFREALEKCFPAPSEMRKRFRFSWQLFEVSLPKAAKLKLYKAAKRDVISKTIEQEAEKARQTAKAFYEQHVAMITQEVQQICAKVAERVTKGEIITERTLESVGEKLKWFERMCGVVDTSASSATLPQIEDLRKLIGNTLACDIRVDPDVANQFQSALKSVGEAVTNMVDVTVRPGQYSRTIGR